MKIYRYIGACIVSVISLKYISWWQTLHTLKSFLGGSSDRDPVMMIYTYTDCLLNGSCSDTDCMKEEARFIIHVNSLIHSCYEDVDIGRLAKLGSNPQCPRVRLIQLGIQQSLAVASPCGSIYNSARSCRSATIAEAQPTKTTPFTHTDTRLLPFHTSSTNEDKVLKI